MNRLVARALCSAFVLLCSALSWPQPARVLGQPGPGGSSEPQQDAAAHRPAAHTFGSRAGFSLAQSLLGSQKPEDQLRALRRLGSVGTRQAILLLVQWIDTNPAVGNQARLVAVRALAPHARQSAVAQALVRIMTGVGNSARKADPLEDCVRSSAALALAASGHPLALEALAQAVRHEGPAAEAAAAALLAYPPSDLSALVEARGAPTRVLVKLLARLGDQRAFHPLRSYIRWATPAVRAEAAVALTELGDLETVELARHWLKHEKLQVLRIAATRVLALAHAPDAPKSVSQLLQDEATRDAAIRLALEAPHPGQLQALETLLRTAEAAQAGRLLMAIARTGGERAATILARELESPARAAPAAYALALTAGGPARARLAQTLGRARTRRHAARAAVVRTLALGESVANTTAILQQLLSSSNGADRAAGAWGLAALDPDWARRLLTSRDAVVVRAAARTAVRAGVTRAAARRLTRELDSLTRAALSIALATSEGADELPTTALIRLVEQGDAAAPLAARALAARDCPELRTRVEALLDNPDALLRSHTALGLGRSQEPSATGLLARTYLLEPNRSVRLAIVTALSQRRETTRMRTLRLAAKLDGDRDVREAARLAAGGRRLDEFVAGHATFWLSVVSNGSEDAATLIQQPALLHTSAGLALPLLPDPDGELVVAGLPEGPVELRLVVSEQRRPTTRLPRQRQGTRRK